MTTIRKTLWSDLAHRRRSWRPDPRSARLAGWTSAAALAGIAGIHAAWAQGWRWPGHDDVTLAQRVVGPNSELPSAGLTYVVAGLLVAAAGAVATATVDAHRLPRLAAWAVAGVLAARGLGGLGSVAAAGLGETYWQLELALYSSLCLALAAGAGIAA
ncbi:DUF3995 domain-containing protein [Nocardia crassostreae]|uniref:DUF3995 domain-containing protein n=1 Tax=Nocardia crassostreae TaxID=53428 RepID=UPI00083517B8|nr:DUF3995 domain-containing protein [Nocardia crassostreae]